MNEKLNTIYQYLSGQNIKNLPSTYDDFVSLMDNDEKAQKIHSYLLSQNIKNVDPDFNVFGDYIGRKKKVETISGGGGVSATLAEPSGEEQLQLPLTEETPQTQEKPIETAKTFGDYVTAFAGGINRGAARIIDDIDYIGTLTEDVIYQLALGKETSNKISQMRKDGTLVRNPLLPPRLTEVMSEILNYAGQTKPLPKSTPLEKITSGILEGTADVIPDIVATMLVPEIKLPSLIQKYGITSLSKFGTVIGAEQVIEGARMVEGGTVPQKITAPFIMGLEGYAQGWMFDNMSLMGGKIGDKIAGRIMPNVKTTTQAIDKALLQQGTATLSTANMFGGYAAVDEYLKTGKVTFENVGTNIGMGIALGLRSPGKLLYAKGLNALLGMPREVLKNVAKSDIKTEDLAKQSQEKIDNVENGTSTNIEGDVLSAKVLSNMSITKAVVDEVIENPQKVIKSIKDSTLEDKAKEALIDKVNEIVMDNDPRAQESNELRDKLWGIESWIETIKENKTLTKTDKELQLEQLELRRAELKEGIAKIYGLPIEEKKKGEEEKPKPKAKIDSKIEDVEKPIEEIAVKEEQPTIDIDVLYLIGNSSLTPDEKNILWRQWKRGVMSLNDIKKYTTVDLEAINRGEIDKWAKVILGINEREYQAKKRKNKPISVEDINFEEVEPKETKEEIEDAERRTQEGSAISEEGGIETGERQVQSIPVRDVTEDREKAEGETREEITPAEAIPEPVKPITPSEIPPTPPTVEKPIEVPEKPAKGKIRKIAQRALDAANLKEDVKEEIRKLGVEYIPRGRKFTEPEIEEIVKLFEGVDDGLDKLAGEVYNTTNGIAPDTRTVFNAILIEKYSDKLQGITDITEREIGRAKLAQSVIFAAEQGTLGGQQVEANKRIARVLMSTPETIVASVREKLDREHREYFADKNTEVDFARKVMQEYEKSGEFKKVIEEGVAEEIAKIGTKKWGVESKKKIDDFFNGLLIDPKRQNLYGGLLGIPVAMYNGSILAIKNALLLGVDLTTAIQRGVEYLDKQFKDEYEKDKVGSPEWNRDQYIADTKERLKPLLKEVGKPKAEKVTPKKGRKEKLPPTQERVVDKLFEKMAKIASRKQLSNFVMKYLQELTGKGVVTDPRFRAILAQALGRSYVTEQTEAKLTDAAKAIGWANKKTEDLAKSFDDYLTEFEQNPQSERLADLKQMIKTAKKQARKAQFAAQKANQQIMEVLKDEPDFIARMGTLIQGGLLVPSSQAANILGNLLLLPATGPAHLISGIADAGLSAIIKKLEPLRSIDPIKHPWIYRWISSMPSEERTILPFAYLRGYIEGVPKYTAWGAKQLITGAVSRDLLKADVQRGIHPVVAAKHFWSQLTGKEARVFSKMVADAIEASPAGYLAEAQFRFLNMGDKPFRGGAETGRLSEIFETGWRNRIAEAKKITDSTQREARIKYLNDSKQVERQRFISNPDTQSLTEARKQGDIATFAQNTGLSKWISSMERYFAGKNDKTMSTIADNLIRLLKITNLPYVKVPINLTSLSIELACPLIPAIKMAVHAQKGDRRSMMDDFGKLIISSALTSVGMSLASNGLITTLSDDKDVRAAQLASGKEEGRLNITGMRRLLRGEDPTWQEDDKIWSVKRLGVASVQLMSIAEAYKNKSPEEIQKMREGNWIEQIVNTNIGMMPYAPRVALNQSIMTGPNTLMQGLLGGEAEKDRWLTSQGTVLSTILYPSTIATISQSVDPERFIRETRDLSKEEGRIKQHMINIFKDKMFMGKNLPPKVTLWGEPVRRIPEGESLMYNILGVTKEKKYQKYSFGTRMYELYEQINQTDPEMALRVFPTLPSSATKVGWEDSKMTPDDLSQYQMRVGQIRAEDAEAFLNSKEWDELNMEDKMTQLESIYLKARKEAEAEMFSWLNYKKVNPESWNIMLDNEALPLPSMTKKVGDNKLINEEIEQLNTTALALYAQEVIPFLTQNTPETLKLMKEYKDEKTGKSDYINELNRIWRRALDDAKVLLESVFAESDNE